MWLMFPSEMAEPAVPVAVESIVSDEPLLVLDCMCCVSFEALNMKRRVTIRKVMERWVMDVMWGKVTER